MVRDDLITWLRAALDEDERAARDAVADNATGQWHVQPEEGPYGIWLHEAVVDNGIRLATGTTRFHQHAVRWDPVRVLDEVKAKRLLLDFLDPTDAPEGEGRFVAEHVLCLLALPYAGRPRWREEWRP